MIPFKFDKNEAKSAKNSFVFLLKLFGGKKNYFIRELLDYK